MKLEVMQRDAAAWITEQRRIFRPGRREACAICGRYRSLTQAHHIVPLALQAARGYEKQNTKFVWLCPTHHAAIHVLFASGGQFTEATMGKACISLVNDLVSSSNELQTLLDLYKMANE